MQIYFLDKCPKKAARYLPDKLVGKMAVESLQLLSTAHEQLGLPIPLRKDGKPFKSIKQGKELVSWLCQSWCNRQWLVLHAVECCHEHYKRYNTVHSSLKSLNELITYQDGMKCTSFPRRWMKGSPIQMLNSIECTVEAYREYMKWKVKENPDKFNWKNGYPEWF